MDYKISRKEALALLQKFEEEDVTVRAMLHSPERSITVSILGYLYISDRGDLNIALPGAESGADVSGIVLPLDWLTAFQYQDLRDAQASAEEKERLRKTAGVSQLRAGLSNGWTLVIVEREPI